MAVIQLVDLCLTNLMHLAVIPANSTVFIDCGSFSYPSAKGLSMPLLLLRVIENEHLVTERVTVRLKASHSLKRNAWSE